MLRIFTVHLPVGSDSSAGFPEALGPSAISAAHLHDIIPNPPFINMTLGVLFDNLFGWRSYFLVPG